MTRAAEKQLKRENEKFDLVDKPEMPATQVVKFPMKIDEPPKKSNSRLMEN